MKTKPLIAFATSISVLTAMLPLDLAQAGGSNGGHAYGRGSSGQGGCKNAGSQSSGKNSGYNVYKPVNVTNTTDNSKNYNVTKNIDNSKNYNITKNIDNSKNTYVDNSKNTYINNSKNININKNVNINNNIDNSKVINDNKNIVISKTININENNNGGGGNTIIGVNAAAAAAAGAAAGGGGGAYIADQSMYQGGNIAVAVDTSAPAQQCVFQDATVVKAIHATCVTADGNEFPASHMVGATWLDAAYEGEVMRCIPGSTLRVRVGEVVQSDQGMASSFTNGQILNCGAHEALRHFKDGMLKCAIEVPVPDCTERTNLRRYGTGDMFFSYRTRVCVQTHREYSEIAQQQESTPPPSESFSESSNGEMALKGMQLDGGIGGGTN